MTKINRRGFLGSVAGAGIAFSFKGLDFPLKKAVENKKPENHHQICAAIDNDIDYSKWLVVTNDGLVHAYTNRTELGQGLRTVMICLISQAMELPQSKVKVVLGDTSNCPDDGATNGSSATSLVAWQFWLACQKVKVELGTIGAKALGLPVDQVEYQGGEIVASDDPSKKIKISELGNGKVIRLDLSTDADNGDAKYNDLGYKNLQGLEIVTGAISFAGDLDLPKTLYGAYQVSPYFNHKSRVKRVNFSQSLKVPGVVKAGIVNRDPAIIGESFSAVQEGLEKIKSRWSKPKRSREIDYEKEIRKNVKYFATREEVGNLDAGFKQSSKIISETYKTHSIQTCPLETDTALARCKKKKVKIWASTQYPFKAMRKTAEYLERPEKDVRIIGTHVGGGFGGKIDNLISAQAAMLSEFAGKPVKYVYSRKDQFTKESRAKETVIVDVISGVDGQGNMLARKTDIFQDEGHGTRYVYDIPNCLTKLYTTVMPVRHATIRGTSYMQDVFAMESHTDEVAHSIGMDPYDLRIKNLFKSEMRILMQEGATMIGYGQANNTLESSTGMALINHGATELGALFVNITINPDTGKITVNKIAAALDFGTVINHHTAMTGVKGAIIWGLGYALHEEILHDGWGYKTTSLWDYHIPKFSDVPPVFDVKFMQPYPVYGPRGCGEMPAPPVAPAIANAFRNATGIRLYETPFSPDRIKKALGK